MADGLDGEGRPPPSSFNGRLDMDSFRWPGAASTATTLSAPRRSKRKAATDTDADADADADCEPASPATPRKRRSRPKACYASPSAYVHLPGLPDALASNLLVLFIGLNPGLRTAQTGHAYNHPSNLFWKLMYSSGVLPVRCAAEEDRSLPARFSLGLTNIVARPTRNGAELTKAEMDEGVGILEHKIRRWRPEAVCIVGKSIWESIWRVRHGKAMAKHEFSYGWQAEDENMGRGDVAEGEQVDGIGYAEDWPGAKVFVASSTSGLAATLRPAEKEKIWNELGEWVQTQRAQREAQQSAP